MNSILKKIFLTTFTITLFVGAIDQVGELISTEGRRVPAAASFVEPTPYVYPPAQRVQYMKTAEKADEQIAKISYRPSNIIAVEEASKSNAQDSTLPFIPQKPSVDVKKNSFLRKPLQPSNRVAELALVPLAPPSVDNRSFPRKPLIRSKSPAELQDVEEGASSSVAVKPQPPKATDPFAFLKKPSGGVGLQGIRDLKASEDSVVQAARRQSVLLTPVQAMGKGETSSDVRPSSRGAYKPLRDRSERKPVIK